jgi:hypothetical protein
MIWWRENEDSSSCILRAEDDDEDDDVCACVFVGTSLVKLETRSRHDVYIVNPDCFF